MKIKVFKKAEPNRIARKNDRLIISYKGFVEKNSLKEEQQKIK